MKKMALEVYLESRTKLEHEESWQRPPGECNNRWKGTTRRKHGTGLWKRTGKFVLETDRGHS